jgi:outer membrane protein
MRSILTLTPIAVAAGMLAFVPAASAQDSNSMPASGRHFTVVGGVAAQKATGSGTINGQRVDFDGEAAPTLSASYNINDNIAIEAWGAGKSGHRVRTAGGKLASVDSQPIAVSGQYHFRPAESSVRPFVGLGYFQSNIDNEKTQDGAALGGQRLGMTTPKGPMATVGVDLNLSPTWFARADARYLRGGSSIAVDGAKAGDANIDPVVVGVGLGARF